MLSELEQLDGLGAELVRRSTAAGVLLIWRAQTRSVRGIVVREGKTESTTIRFVSGHGLQVVTPEGRHSLGSRDDFREEPALALLQRVADAARGGSSLG